MRTTSQRRPIATLTFSLRLATSCSAIQVRAGSSRGRLASRDRMYRQNFVLLARDFLDALTGCHVKWLRAGLGFIFGNHLVDFVHVGACWIVFEKRRITVR